MTPPTLLHVFPTFAVGGQQTRLATIANRLGSAASHRLISLDGRDQAVALLNPDLDFALLSAPSPSSNLLERMRRIAALCRATRYDILVTYNWGAIEFALANRLFLRRPNIHFEDGFGPEEAHHQKMRRVLIRRLVLQHALLIVPSRKLEEIAHRAWRLAPHRVTYIPNGIDPRRFDSFRSNGTPFFVQQEGECIIGSFSPLRREKNIGRLLTAFAQLSPLPARLVVCGDGPERAALMQLAEGLGILNRVSFTGHVPRPELIMGAFDLFAITSDTEQMPYAVLEAMAARLPVVATDVGDISLMVADKNRPFVIAPADTRGLAEALTQLCTDAPLRRQIGHSNRAKVQEQFGIEPMVEAFRHILSRVIETQY